MSSSLLFSRSRSSASMMMMMMNPQFAPSRFTALKSNSAAAAKPFSPILSSPIISRSFITTSQTLFSSQTKTQFASTLSKSISLSLMSSDPIRRFSNGPQSAIQQRSGSENKSQHHQSDEEGSYQVWTSPRLIEKGLPQLIMAMRGLNLWLFAILVGVLFGFWQSGTTAELLLATHKQTHIELMALAELERQSNGSLRRLLLQTRNEQRQLHQKLASNLEFSGPKFNPSVEAEIEMEDSEFESPWTLDDFVVQDDSRQHQKQKNRRFGYGSRYVQNSDSLMSKASQWVPFTSMGEPSMKDANSSKSEPKEGSGLSSLIDRVGEPQDIKGNLAMNVDPSHKNHRGLN